MSIQLNRKKTTIIVYQASNTYLYLISSPNLQNNSKKLIQMSTLQKQSKYSSSAAPLSSSLAEPKRLSWLPSSQTLEGMYNSSLHFFIGGLSGAIATMLIQPIDTMKVQIQVVSELRGKNLAASSEVKPIVNNSSVIGKQMPHQAAEGRKFLFMFEVMKQIYREKGFKILYRGLGSAIWRQIFYASARLGTYTWLVQKMRNNGVKIGIKEKVGISALSGIVGAIIGNPFDVALIRRQASVTTGKNAYNSTIHAFSSIVKQQGFLKLWRGIDITMLRVLLINVGQLAGNEIITDLISPLFKTTSTNFNPNFMHNVSAILASVLTAFLSLPADNIKVKMQKQTDKQRLYSGITDCFLKTVRREGFLRLWVGFPIYLIRGMPHSFVLIRTQQFLKSKLLKSEKY